MRRPRGRSSQAVHLDGGVSEHQGDEREMQREQMIEAARSREHDVVIVGGGATGLGLALDAASRGFRTLLLEARDFGKGTSSRSTKLIHGGLRYLKQGNVRLVREASAERGLLLRLAPHLVRPLGFYLPTHGVGEWVRYGLGLEIYGLMAGRFRIGGVRRVRMGEAQRRFPTLRAEHRRGGFEYWDGQFDDARYLIHLCRTAVRYGCTVLNYAPVVGLHRGIHGRVEGVSFVDAETGEQHEVRARVVINAAGPFVDSVRRLLEPNAERSVILSRGSHLVVDRRVLPGDRAVIVPETPDGRVLFLIPWHGRVLIGTTDVHLETPTVEPTITPEEVRYILKTAEGYLREPIRADQIRAAFAGIRALAAPRGLSVERTSDVPRDHVVSISRTGLVTIVGGKWTTYRWMAEDCLNRVMAAGLLPHRPCRTRAIKLDGYVPHHPANGFDIWEGAYASRKALLMRDEPELGAAVVEGAPLRYVDVLWAVREEMARTVEDVLARRTRLLFLDTHLAAAAALPVARFMAKELGRSGEWIEEQCRSFRELCAALLQPVHDHFARRA